MSILARFMNFCDFYDFRKTVAIAFVGISKIPMVNFEIHSLFVLKIFVFQSHKFVPRKIGFREQTERFFGCAIERKDCQHDSCSY